MRALPGLFAALLSIALAVPGWNGGKADADEVIALARAALRGEATLESFRSLSASGTVRRSLPFGGGPISGELDLDLLPDRGSALVADQAWTGPVVAALLLRTPASDVRFSYVGEVEAPHGRSDVVDITAPDGFAARLFLDQASHLPLMLTYAGFPEAEPSTEEGGIPEPQRSSARGSTLTLFLSDYREVEGIRLPHSLSRAVNGALVEEWAIDGWRVAFASHHEGFASP